MKHLHFVLSLICLLLLSGWTLPSETALSLTASRANFGDVSGNGMITAFDASLVLQHVAGNITLSDEAAAAAEVSGNGQITPFDAALILQHATDLISCFPADPNCPS